MIQMVPCQLALLIGMVVCHANQQEWYHASRWCVTKRQKNQHYKKLWQRKDTKLLFWEIPFDPNLVWKNFHYTFLFFFCCWVWGEFFRNVFFATELIKNDSTSNEWMDGQWLWHSWQTGCFRHQRSAVWIPSSAKNYLSIVLQRKDKKEEAGIDPFKTYK